MSSSLSPVEGLNPVLQPYIQYWTQYVEQSREAQRTLLSGFEDFADARVWQRRWLQAVSQSMDAYLRSPVFMAAMKQTMHAAFKMKMQADDLRQEVARNNGIPTSSDISGLFERLRSAEEEILAELSQIHQKLAALESQHSAGATKEG